MAATMRPEWDGPSGDGIKRRASHAYAMDFNLPRPRFVTEMDDGQRRRLALRIGFAHRGVTSSREALEIGRAIIARRLLACARAQDSCL
jgi:hypothetical protein